MGMHEAIAYPASSMALRIACRQGNVWSVTGRARTVQVTRKWLNWEGVASVQHIAALIEEMEEDPRVQHALAAKAK